MRRGDWMYRGEQSARGERKIFGSLASAIEIRGADSKLAVYRTDVEIGVHLSFCVQ